MLAAAAQSTTQVFEADPETIAAVSTPSGNGGIGVIRVSGKSVPTIMTGILGETIPPRYAAFAAFHDASGHILDKGLAIYFPAPHSFTGESILELHAHGNPILLDLILKRILQLGARIAKPGEFSERAFLNNKMDLAQAEAVADLINSTSEQAVKSASRSLQGEFSRYIDELLNALIELRLFIEASIDFSDEEIDLLSEGNIAEKINSIIEQLKKIGQSAQQGRLLRDGLTIIIAGLPNAGKSSLLNLLADREAAIVTEIAGTTRDLLREYIQIDGLPLHIVDTAGLRESTDAIEQEGIRRAYAEITKADRVLLIIDDRAPETAATLISKLPPEIPVTRIFNKIDLSGNPPGCYQDQNGPAIRLSVKTGEGYPELLQHLKLCAGYDSTASEGVFCARRRHLEAIQKASDALERAQQLMQLNCAELLAEELRYAQNALGEIKGEFTSDDLLGRIFSSFCIGK